MKLIMLEPEKRDGEGRAMWAGSLVTVARDTRMRYRVVKGDWPDVHSERLYQYNRLRGGSGEVHPGAWPCANYVRTTSN
jgi:hypothetical protein